MNTPTHAVVNLLVAGRRREIFWAVLVGAVLPDAAMLLFYGLEKMQGLPDQQIWSETYFSETWQRFFDIFNSLPLLLAGTLIGWFAGSRFVTALMLSMLFHGICDLWTHANHVHRHFYPFADWRFINPLTYWRIEHLAEAFRLAEAALTVGGSAALFWLHRDWRARLAVVTIALCYGGLWLATAAA